MEVDNNDLKNFCKSYNLKSLVRVPTCFKNPENPSCIDLILANFSNSFQSSCTTETGLSDFYKMTASVMKASFHKMKSKIITYRNYKLLSNKLYKEDESFQFNKLKRFLEVRENTLNRHVPCKKKFIRGYHSPFISKAIMKRTRLRNKFLRNKSYRDNFIKQSNYCVHLRKEIKKGILW